MDSCNLCGHDAWAVHLACSNFPSGHLVRCRHCGLIRVGRLPSRNEIVGYYQDEYYKKTGGRFGGPVERLVHLFRRRRAHKVMDLSPPGRILDIGCGRGLMLATLKQAGWTVLGTQVSKNAAAYAQEVLGIEVIVGDVLEARFPSQSFDVITLYQVLEHLPNPGEYLDEIHRLLKPGGWLILEVPNAGGVEARLFGCAWLAWDPPHHLYHFAPEVLIPSVEQRGLRVVETGFFSLEYGPFTFLQSCLNLLSAEKNLLYRFLQATTPAARQQFRPARLLLHGLLASLLVVPSVLAAAIFATFKMGNNLTLYARKT